MKSPTSKPPLILLAGGGTGGHIFPAMAIARALEADPALPTRIHLVGGKSELEKSLFSKAHWDYSMLAGGKLNFQGSRLKKIANLFLVAWGLIQSFWLLLRLRPAFVLGVGGYASGPAVLAAAILRIPCGVWEPNAWPGLANRWLAKWVDVCFLVVPQAAIHLKGATVVPVGMPLREEFESAAIHLNSEPKTIRRSGEEFRILVTCGSQGSRAINQAVSRALLDLGSWSNGIQLVHQVGSADWQRMQEVVARYPSSWSAKEFLHNMPELYAWADVVICRGGMSTLTEVCAMGVVPIVIPLPAADDHQTHNALNLVNHGAACLLPQKELEPERLKTEIERLRGSPELREEMSRSLRRLFRPQAAAHIATEIRKRMT